MLYYLVDTQYGWLGFAGTEGRISLLELPRETKPEAVEALQNETEEDLVEADSDFSGQAERLRAYFVGEPVEFDCELDYGSAGSFDVRVWNAAREILYGELDTYGGLAARIGQPKAARAVGQALGRNRIPLIVPCHRVVGANGDLRGFACGCHWKERLLGLEGRK